MGRNQRKTRTIGFQTGECWGDILGHEPSQTPSGEAARHLYRYGGAGGGPMVPRLMVKFEEIERDAQAHAKAVARIERAMSYGCEIELCVDWFNKADGRSSYHQRVYMPQQKSVKHHVRDLVREFRPAELEVCNEFWHTKGQADMTMEQYSRLVYEYAEGCEMAGGQMPQLNASTKMDKPRDKPQHLWVWDIPYDNCCEVYHRFIMDQDGDHPRNAEQLEEFLEMQAHIQRGKAIGWIWPLKCNETTLNGSHVDINSREGADMVRVTLEHYTRYKYPASFLAMGGFKAFGDGGEWGLEVDFVDDKGNLSLGAEAWLDFVGAEPYEGPGEPEEPGNGGAGDGSNAIKNAAELASKASNNWGKNEGYRQARQARGKITRALENAGEE